MDTNELKNRLEKSLEHFKEDLKALRTGRANPSLVEELKVDYYGTPTPLKQVSSINVPEARLLVISPYDRTLLSKIEKAITESDLGLSATNDGNVIRITLPPLSEERRNEIVKVAHEKAEEAKVTMRNIRREAVEEIDKQEKAGDISEDDKRRQEKEIQDKLDSYTKQVEETVSAKEAEIKEV